MTRICVTKGAGGGASTGGFPAERLRGKSQLNEDECFYRPEVQGVWAAGIAHRITNLPIQPSHLFPGDENSLNLKPVLPLI